MGVAISQKINSKTKEKKPRTLDKDGHFIMIRGTIHQDDITLLNIHAPSQGASKYVKLLLTELKEVTDKNTIIVEILKHTLQL